MACNIFHRGKYYVSYKRGFEDTKKDITVTVEKIFENDTLRISLSDEHDPSFLCLLNVTRSDYEDLKKQQGLLIDYNSFPAQLVRLLQQCAANNMFLILQQMNPLRLCFEIVEHNEFKRLVHLSLTTEPATDADIKQHMAQSINNLKKTLENVKSTATSNEVIWNDKCKNLERKVNDLSHVISKLEEEKVKREKDFQDMMIKEKERVEQERNQWQKTCETNMKSQIGAAQDTVNRKDNQIEELNALCRQLKDNIGLLENQLSEKSQRLNCLEGEVQKSHIEVATLKARNTSLERDVMEKDKKYQQLHSKCQQLEKTIKDNTVEIFELKDSLHNLRKEKNSLSERLALSESLANRNNEAVQASSEQLLKANQIISKQNADLIEMKEKILCRTAIALEQEKVIERNTKEIEDLKAQILNAKQCTDKLESELIAVKEKCERNEEALKERDETIKNNNMVIQWLHKKMEGGYERAAPAASTPYTHQHNNSTADDSINFYATSKLSNIEDSPQPQAEQKRVGLDPKYLKPASDDKQSKKPKDTGRPKSNDLQKQKGKENTDINLPKVDYREKKSSRPTTYRATPVSAYFP